MLDTILAEDIFVPFSLHEAKMGDRPVARRTLADLRGCFADESAYRETLSQSNPLLYEVCALEPATGHGQLHAGLGILYPGKIGNEYYLTKGHYHADRPAAEFYIGLRGEGAMLLEDEHSGESRLVPLHKNSLVYVPGHTAHRTINTGDQPLVYIGIYPASAGHDYAALAEKNFRKILVEQDGIPFLTDRPQ